MCDWFLDEKMLKCDQVASHEIEFEGIEGLILTCSKCLERLEKAPGKLSLVEGQHGRAWQMETLRNALSHLSEYHLITPHPSNDKQVQ